MEARLQLVRRHPLPRPRIRLKIIPDTKVQAVLSSRQLDPTRITCAVVENDLSVKRASMRKTIPIVAALVLSVLNAILAEDVDDPIILKMIMTKKNEPGCIHLAVIQTTDPLQTLFPTHFFPRNELAIFKKRNLAIVMIVTRAP